MQRLFSPLRPLRGHLPQWGRQVNYSIFSRNILAPPLGELSAPKAMTERVFSRGIHVMRLAAMAACFVFVMGCGEKYEMSWTEIPAGTKADGTPYPRFWIASFDDDMYKVCKDSGWCDSEDDFCGWMDSERARPWQTELWGGHENRECAMQCRSDGDCKYGRCSGHVCWDDCPCGYKPEDMGCIQVDPGAGAGDYEFACIPGGDWKITHETAEYPSGSVTTKPFMLGKAPVTVEQFKKCVDARACTTDNFNTRSSGETSCNYGRGDEYLNHPMNCVNWTGAEQYCTWIGGRLPTEEEWEYAATHDGSGHSYMRYPWGDSAPLHCLTANYSGAGSNKYCSGTNEVSYMAGTSAVGTYSPKGDSPLGLVDMAGNVWEWTSSTVQDKYDLWQYVLKGGSWLIGDEESLDISARREDYPSEQNSFYGFRCAK